MLIGSSLKKLLFYEMVFIVNLTIFGSLTEVSVQGKPLEYFDLNETAKVSAESSEYYGNLSPAIIRKIQNCDRNMSTMELCMRCAKVTKSAIVYPLCCANEDNVKNWCHDYIYFGASN